MMIHARRAADAAAIAYRAASACVSYAIAMDDALRAAAHRADDAAMQSQTAADDAAADDAAARIPIAESIRLDAAALESAARQLDAMADAFRRKIANQ